ncbi:MAG: DUF4870 domain-containing protein [Candidatus Hydrothermarchaeota archaeon]
MLYIQITNNEQGGDSIVSEDEKLLGLLAYFPLGLIGGIVVYFLKPESDFCRFHARQSIALGIILMGVYVILTILGAIFIKIPLLGWLVWLLLGVGWLIVAIAGTAIYLFLAIKAFLGEKTEIPVLSRYI